MYSEKIWKYISVKFELDLEELIPCYDTLN